MPFGSVVDDQYNWPNKKTSETMKCGLNMYKPIDRPMHEIIDELASDNEVFAEKFLDGWQMMTSNGYFKVIHRKSLHNANSTNVNSTKGKSLLELWVITFLPV